MPVETQVKRIMPIGIQWMDLHSNLTVQKRDNKLEPELQLKMNSNGEQLTGRLLADMSKGESGLLRWQCNLAT